jgi:hypothetical protein
MKNKVQATKQHEQQGVIVSATRQQTTRGDSRKTRHNFERSKARTASVVTLLLEQWEDDSHTPKMGTWESVGTPEILKFDFRGQNTLH